MFFLQKLCLSSRYFILFCITFNFLCPAGYAFSSEQTIYYTLAAPSVFLNVHSTNDLTLGMTEARKKPFEDVSKVDIGAEVQKELNEDFLKACRTNDINKVKELLEKGAELHAQDKHGNTCFHTALDFYYPLLFEYLIELDLREKSNLNERERFFYAINREDIEYVHELIEKGFDVNTIDSAGWTAAHWASAKGNTTLLKYLFDHGANIKQESNYKETPLSTANYTAVAQFLISNGADIHSRNEYDITPLGAAAIRGHKAVVDLLLRAGSDIESRDKDNCTPLHDAAQFGHKAVVELLLSYGADIESKSKTGNTPLHLASWKGSKVVADLLLRDGSDKESRNKDNDTPLHLASLKGHKAVVDLLLRAGSDIGSRQNENLTPLHIAALCGHPEVVELLLRAGSDIESRLNENLTPLHLASLKGHKAVVGLLLIAGSDKESINIYNRTPLHIAALYGHPEVVDLLLIAGSDIELKTKKGNTPLHLASREGHKAVVELLLIAGSDIESKTKQGNTPLHLASWKGHKDVVELFLFAGSNKESKDKDNRTPLHDAAQFGHKAVVELLLSYGADIELKTKKGNTPLHLASLYGHKDVVELLLIAGSDIESRDDDNRTPIHLASRQGHKDVVEIFLKVEEFIKFINKNNAYKVKEFLRCPFISLNTADENGKQAIELAFSSGYHEIIALLMKDLTGISRLSKLLSLVEDKLFDVQDNQGATLLHHATNANNSELCEWLLKKGERADIRNNNFETAYDLFIRKKENFSEEIRELFLFASIKENLREDISSLYKAFKEGDNERVNLLFEEYEVDIDERSNKGYTALHLAVMNNDFRLVQTLLEYGANIGARTLKNNSLLHLAVLSQDLNMIESFLRRGLNLRQQNDDGENAIDIVHREGTDEVKQFFEQYLDIFEQIKQGNYEVVKNCLKQGVVSVNEVNEEGLTPLHYAVQYLEVEIIELLLDHVAFFRSYS